MYNYRVAFNIVFVDVLYSEAFSITYIELESSYFSRSTGNIYYVVFYVNYPVVYAYMVDRHYGWFSVTFY